MAITRSKRRELESSLAKRRRESESSRKFHLPCDIVVDILSHLHVKALLRFKSTCKTWFSVIQNPTFVKNHLTRSKKLNPIEESMLLIRNCVKNSAAYCTTLLQFRDGNGTYESDKILFPHFVQVDGICDGLVWANLRDHRTKTIIFNPATGKIRRVPPSDLPISEYDIVFLGFRLLQTDGYSLFRIVYSHYPYVVLRGEVCSMSTETWREIGVKREEGRINPHLQLSKRSPFFSPLELDGVFYWQVYGYSGGGSVVSFDTCDNMFVEIPWPVDYIAGGYASKILEFKGELAMPVHKGLVQEFDLWVLDVKGRSWTKKFMLEDLSRIGWGVSFFGCARNGKLVLQHSGRKLVSYDPESREIEDLPFNGDEGNNFYLYSTSLISV